MKVAITHLTKLYRYINVPPIGVAIYKVNIIYKTKSKIVLKSKWLMNSDLIVLFALTQSIELNNVLQFYLGERDQHIRGSSQLFIPGKLRARFIT